MCVLACADGRHDQIVQSDAMLSEIKTNCLRVWAEPLLCAFLRLRPSGGLVKTVAGAGEGARTCADERGCLPERCHSPQGGQTPLHLAAEKGCTGVVKHLLAAGAAVDAKDKVREEGGADRGYPYLLSAVLS